MKKQLTLTVTRQEKVQVEVEFPIYSKYDDVGDHSSWECYYRLDANGDQVCIKKTEYYSASEIEYEISKKSRVEIRNASDLELGKGENACTPEEFNAALEGAVKFTQSLIVAKE